MQDWANHLDRLRIRDEPQLRPVGSVPARTPTSFQGPNTLYKRSHLRPYGLLAGRRLVDGLQGQTNLDQFLHSPSFTQTSIPQSRRR